MDSEAWALAFALFAVGVVLGLGAGWYLGLTAAGAQVLLRLGV